MKFGSLPRLSTETERLLAEEREFPPEPEPTRRRALLRAQHAIWHARQERHSSPVLLTWWRRVGLAAAVVLLTTAGAAAWLVMSPTDPAKKAGGEPANTQTKRGLQKSAKRPQTTPAPPPERGEEATRPKAADESADTEPPAAAKPAPRAAAPEPEGAPKPEAEKPSNELLLLDSARRAVMRRDYSLALAQVEAHQRKFPKSVLSEEREALRIRALEGAGLERKAEKAASRFQSRYPDSVLAPQTKPRARERE